MIAVKTVKACYLAEVSLFCCQMQSVNKGPGISFFHVLADHRSEELRESWEVTGMTRINLESENAL